MMMIVKMRIVLLLVIIHALCVLYVLCVLCETSSLSFCLCEMVLFVRNENSSQIRKFEEEEEEEVKEVKFNQQGRNGTQTDFDE